MNNITNKTKTILFASLLVAMILPFSTMDFAEAEKNNIGDEMKQIHDQIKNTDGSEKTTLKAEYFLLNNELNASLHQTPERNFVDEWQSFESISLDLMEQRFTETEELKQLKDSNKAKIKQAKIDEIDFKVDQIRSNIDKLQLEAIDSMTLEEDTRLGMLETISGLDKTYGLDNSDNGYVMAGIDYEQKKIIVELTTENDDGVKFENTSIAIAESIRNLVGETNVIITVDNVQLTSCTNYLSTCTPRVGGVAIARSDASSSLAGSIGYKAIYGTVTGYVTAGHVVDFSSTGNRKMLQPVSGSQISDGTYYPWTNNALSGDVSFQKTSVSINDDLYFSSSIKVDVKSYATGTIDHPGQFIYKMGAGNGLTSGQVTSHWVSLNVWRTDALSATGDSGGPIFKITGSSGGLYEGKVFGHVYAKGSVTNGAYYQPTDKIIANYGIYPALS